MVTGMGVVCCPPCPNPPRNMDIIGSEEAMTAAVMRELISGRQLLESLGEAKERQAAAIASSFRGHHNKKHSMRHIAEIPFDEFVWISNKYGQEAWSDKEFLRDAHRHNPHLFSHKPS